MVLNYYAEKFGPIVGAEVDKTGTVVGIKEFYPEELPAQLWINFAGANTRKGNVPHWSAPSTKDRKRKENKCSKKPTALFMTEPLTRQPKPPNPNPKKRPNPCS